MIHMIPTSFSLPSLSAKRRRELRNFPAADFILQQLKDKPTRKRVGLLSKGAPPRGEVIFKCCVWAGRAVKRTGLKF